MTSQADTIVMFKCESFDADGREVGPVIVIDVAARAADPNVTGKVGMPYGYQPDWRTDLGYKTLGEAEQVAADRGVELTYA